MGVSYGSRFITSIDGYYSIECTAPARLNKIGPGSCSVLLSCLLSYWDTKFLVMDDALTDL